MPLEPGQFQIGSVIMGPKTPFKIESVDIANYEINAQDFQNQSSDEIRFGIDTLKPSPIHLSINVLVNRPLPNVKSLVHDYSAIPTTQTLSDLQREWRADDIRSQWGVIKPLLFCAGDGVTRQFYGRPGKFTYKMHRTINSEYYQVVAEFRRADTLCYSNGEYYTSLSGSPTTIYPGGEANAWFRLLVYGPSTPSIDIGGQRISLAYTVGSGEIVEISSYPWSRRIVSTNGRSLAAYNNSPDPFLDKYKLSYSGSQCSFTGGGSVVLLWRSAYQVMM